MPESVFQSDPFTPESTRYDLRIGRIGPADLAAGY
jgi:hypothetical protein